MTEPDNDTHTPVRPAAGHARRQSSLAGFKPFLLAGLLVVIGLLVGLNFLLGGSGDSSAPDAPVAGAITIGPPPGGFPTERDTPLAPPSEPPALPSGGTPSGSAPVSPSEFTFYETLKKPSHDPGATVGLTPPKSPSNPPARTAPAPSAPASAAKATAEPPKPAPSKSAAAATPAAPSHAAAPKPVPAKNRVIETTTAGHGAHQYTIQVAAFRQQEMAEQMIKELNKKGHEAYLATASSSDGNGKTYRVRVGRFATREEADRTAKQLAANGKLHPFITTIDPGTSKKG
ncbi:MAG: SPOR domain-containing protein [Nitrospirae bacterium]|nr:SPOR domain-containing protein [Nitrospirota bacterium]